MAWLQSLPPLLGEVARLAKRHEVAHASAAAAGNRAHAAQASLAQVKRTASTAWEQHRKAAIAAEERCRQQFVENAVAMGFMPAAAAQQKLRQVASMIQPNGGGRSRGGIDAFGGTNADAIRTLPQGLQECVRGPARTPGPTAPLLPPLGRLIEPAVDGGWCRGGMTLQVRPIGRGAAAR